MNIAICDDEHEQIKLIKNYLQRFFGCDTTVNIDTYDNSTALMKAISNGKLYEMLFLDIEIGRYNGTDVAFEIRKQDKRMVIFFISSYPQYVSRAFRVEAFQFLVKPVDEEELFEEVKRALNKLEESDYRYCISTKDQLFSLRPDEIIYIETYRRLLHIQTLERKITIYGSLNDEEKRLAPYGFLRVHQGFLVNMKHIVSIGEGKIQCTQDFSVPVSVRKLSYVVRQYNLYLSQRSI